MALDCRCDGDAARVSTSCMAGVAGGAVRRAAESQSLNTSPGFKRSPSFSPDGTGVAFSWNSVRQNNPDIYTQQIGSGTPVRLTTDPRNDFTPAWSPDGRWIAFLRETSPGNSELRLIPAYGGPEHLVTKLRYVDFPNPPSIAWCPDSERLVVTDSIGVGRPDALFVVSVGTGEKKQLTNPQPAAGDLHPAISSDRRLLVFRRHRGTWTGELYWLRLGNGFTPSSAPQRLTADLHADYPTWMRNSKEILFSAQGGLWRIAVPSTAAPARLPFVGHRRADANDLAVGAGRVTAARICSQF
jgi:Tol biopolymer transport system component